MTFDQMQHVDDLTPAESIAIVQAYDDVLAHETHEAAFASASDLFQRLRPELPLSLLAIELEMLLAGAPADPVAMAC